MGGEGQWGLLGLASARQDSKRVRAVGMEKASAQKAGTCIHPDSLPLLRDRAASQRGAGCPASPAGSFAPLPLAGSGLGKGAGRPRLGSVGVGPHLHRRGSLKRAEGPADRRQTEWSARPRPGLRPFEGGGQPPGGAQLATE